MAKFTFRLETLWKIREQERQERQAELVQAHEAERVLEARQNEVATQLDDLLELNRRLMVGTVQVDRLLNIRRHEALLQAHRMELQQQRALVQQEIERRRQQLVEANREVRILEKLREKQAARHREEERARDVRQMDEIASARSHPQGARHAPPHGT